MQIGNVFAVNDEIAKPGRGFDGSIEFVAQPRPYVAAHSRIVHIENLNAHIAKDADVFIYLECRVEITPKMPYWLLCQNMH